MATKHLHIPGFREAIQEERELRNEIYLNAPRNICGVLVNQITPSLHAKLMAIRSPFFTGGEVTNFACAHFLWICSKDFATEFVSDPRLGKVGIWKRIWNRVLGRREVLIDPKELFIARVLSLDFEFVEDAIDKFIEDTYMDSPSGGSASVPYYSAIASLEYTMSCDPFGWDWEKTQNVPLRRIYQLMKAQRHNSGGLMYNERSDKVKQEFIDDLATGRVFIPKGDN